MIRRPPRSTLFPSRRSSDLARSTGGRVTTLEVNPEKIALAHANLASAGLDGVVEIIEGPAADTLRSEEHTSELQSLAYLVCRLLLEKKKKRAERVIKHRHHP